MLRDGLGLHCALFKIETAAVKLFRPRAAMALILDVPNRGKFVSNVPALDCAFLMLCDAVSML